MDPKMRNYLLMPLMLVLLAATPALSDNKVTNKAKKAVDPDCSVTRAAKGVAMKSTVGVGNRCSVGETARDVTGVDGAKDKASKKKLKK